MMAVMVIVEVVLATFISVSDNTTVKVVHDMHVAVVAVNVVLVFYVLIQFVVGL